MLSQQQPNQLLEEGFLLLNESAPGHVEALCRERVDGRQPSRSLFHSAKGPVSGGRRGHLKKLVKPLFPSFRGLL